jgi:hypothetical protein
MTSTTWSTQIFTVSNAKTATVVDTTVTKITKRAEPTLTEKTATVSKILPIIEVILDKASALDALQDNLQKIGLLVKRDTVTNTVTAAIPTTTTITSTLSSNVANVYTSTYVVSSTIRSTVFVNADQTVHATSTISIASASTPATDAAVSNSAAPSPNMASSSKSLSTAAQAGIGVGTASGSLIICIIIFFFWRRRSQKSAANVAPIERSDMTSPEYKGASTMTSSTASPTPIVPELYHSGAGQNQQQGWAAASNVPSAYQPEPYPPPVQQYGRPLSQEELARGYTLRPLSPQELQNGYSRRHEMPNTGYQAGMLNQQGRYEMHDSQY